MHLGGLAVDLIVILTAGAVAGMICARFRISLLAGYLLVGALIGRGGLGLVANPGHDLEQIAEIGALFLLFSVGIEISLGELSKMGRFFFVGGSVQMVLTAIPLTAVAWWLGLRPAGAILAGLAGAFSSTVLVFRALSESGATHSPHGRRGIALLLFQDAALIPLLLLIPLVSGDGPAPSWTSYLLLAVKGIGFVLAVLLLHGWVGRIGVPRLAAAKRVELLVLVTLSLLGLICWGAYRLELPVAVGAFASGLVLSGTRISRQIDAIVLPFREAFAAVFFVSLGMLLQPREALSEPLLLGVGLVGMVAVKTVAAALALRLIGLSWPSAWGMGLGLAQLGEFSFLLASRGVAAGIITTQEFNRMLFIAVATLIATPFLLRWGLRWVESTEADAPAPAWRAGTGGKRGLVIGIGPIGGQLATLLESRGVPLTMIDLSPVNLHPFAQKGFDTFSGDAREPGVLQQINVRECGLAVVCVPKDEVALEIVRALRQANPTLTIVVRCRFQLTAPRLLRAGARAVVSEEEESVGPLMRHCEKWLSGDSATAT